MTRDTENTVPEPAPVLPPDWRHVGNGEPATVLTPDRQDVEGGEAAAVPAPDRPPQRRRPATGPTEPVVWWRRPWVVPLAVVVLGYLWYQLSPFAALDPTTAPTPPHPGFPAYYPLLLVHMTAGTIAMLTVIFQMWPWLRISHPRVHRVCGRLYVVAALVGGTMGLILVRFAPPVGQIGVSMATLTWMITTVGAFVMARRRHFVLHRRFMLYSFAIVMNNVWGVIITGVGMHLAVPIPINYLIEGARWVGWVGNLMLVQWWLYRTARQPIQLSTRRT